MLKIVGCVLLCVTTTLAVNTTIHNQIMAGTNTLFTAIDKNKDGLMEEYELENAWESVDTDPMDHRISLHEYTVNYTPHAFYEILFLELDYDGDGYLDRSAILGQFSVADANSDNEVSRIEFDRYYTGIVESALRDYGHLIGLGTTT